MIRQPSSRMCFVCGRDNPIGLRLQFDFDGERAWTRFTPDESHQGYPGILHGGLTSAILDEVIGRTAIAHDLWMVTARIEIRYHAPIPIGQPLTAVGEILGVKRRLMQARAEIRLVDDTVAAEAIGTFVEAPAEIRVEWEREKPFWRVDDE
jgi:acyl-coenzyme A thioesterase PaaI-like protein